MISMPIWLFAIMLPLACCMIVLIIFVLILRIKEEIDCRKIVEYNKGFADGLRKAKEMQEVSKDDSGTDN